MVFVAMMLAYFAVAAWCRGLARRLGHGDWEAHLVFRGASRTELLKVTSWASRAKGVWRGECENNRCEGIYDHSQRRERELLVHAADTAALKSRVQSQETTSFMAIKALNTTAKYVQGIHSINILIA